MHMDMVKLIFFAKFIKYSLCRTVTDRCARDRRRLRSGIRSFLIIVHYYKQNDKKLLQANYYCCEYLTDSLLILQKWACIFFTTFHAVFYKILLKFVCMDSVESLQLHTLARKN